ncbi:DUF1580 domain-containing protein [Aeoliella sp. SH292]|uniref:DUF1580 domain-containing protein n=1 Tax=Aeoliella sp. SH292 TaxID=3454464 RepID=UPI003F9444B6
MKLFEESRLSLTKLAQQQDVNVSTVWRWAQRGVRGVRLETLCIGGRRFTTNEAWGRFVDLTTRVATGQAAIPCVPDQRDREIAEAEAFLDAEGV